MKKVQIDYITSKLNDVYNVIYHKLFEKKRFILNTPVMHMGGVEFENSFVYDLIREGKVSMKPQSHIRNHEQNIINIFDFSKYIKVKKKYIDDLDEILNYVAKEKANIIDQMIISELDITINTLKTWEDIINSEVDEKLKKVEKNRPNF